MRIPRLLQAASLSTLLCATAHSHGSLPEVPPGYPSHIPAGNCGTAEQLTQLQQRLSEYNLTRLGIAAVLRKMADKYALEADTRDGLLGFARNFDDMQKNLPAPDPDSDDFRNFDFRLGLALTALTVFLNTQDEALAKHIYDDRGDPTSDLALYLAHLDSDRDSYMASLDKAGTRQDIGGVPCAE
jgi:hypothetical protein